MDNVVNLFYLCLEDVNSRDDRNQKLSKVKLDDNVCFKMNLVI